MTKKNTSITSTLRPLALPPLSLYVHIPWCERKCPYCDFNSHTTQHQIPEALYIDCLVKDIEQQLTHIQNRKVSSVFFGGGTPSLFSGSGIASILSRINDHIDFAPDIEITLEANPGTTEQKRFREYLKAGVNRLSIGIQSLNDSQLNALGRIHDSQQAISAVKAAKSEGFDNFNLDLMHGLPNQTLEQAIDDLAQAVQLGAKHLSWYQLTIEKNTAFYKQPPTLPHNDLLADIESEGFKLLAREGYQQYEISAFATENHQSKHNLNYWRFGDYIGIGAGAHSKITHASTNTIIRNQKTRLPDDYMDHLSKTIKTTDESAGLWRTVETSALPLEFMMNCLRLVDGVPSVYFQRYTGLPLQEIEGALTRLRAQNLMAESSERIASTELGRRFLNNALEEFMA
ncbi:radical SAM family heme chaperone HemW [Aurantivibrio infirmus]